jgi:hypothetical protein
MKDFDDIKMHGTTIKKMISPCFNVNTQYPQKFSCKYADVNIYWLTLEVQQNAEPAHSCIAAWQLIMPPTRH